ncbi:MAG: ribbon-helix-helix domain-containing protein [candidate division NC10 bacterium]|nr:ribbon-helix-helix domain-containing protein [candidate division NC10 bacterium]MBI3084365.1 ribbon-helix-helix domain-containing protein [candidate division NC10 bacterium]
MARHRLSVTFSLSAKQVELLDRLAQRTNVPKSVYVRKGVDVILRRYRGLLQRTGPPEVEANEKQ